ncbi:MAG: AMP-binding protein [Deltaproteobacteria bacterium]|nr:AMP-binding protein [Deltaproteobacteria bacterium]
MESPASPSWEPYFWNFEEECLPISKLRARQAEAWEKCLEQVLKTPFYQKKLKQFHPSQNILQHIEDIPFTTKQDLRDHYPYGLLQVPLEKIVETHASSGSSGQATLVAYSKQDLEIWTDLIARGLTASGIRPGQIIHNAYGYGLFTGGLGFQYGAQRIGAIVNPISNTELEKQIRLIQELGSQVLLCTPSCAMSLAATALKMGLKPHQLGLKVGIFGGESYTPEFQRKLEEIWNIKAWNTYGLSEIIGPGVAYECPHGEGIHLNEDHFYPEVVDFATGQSLSEDRMGELVLSAITKEAMPLLRYRTGDRVKISYAPCSCGRKLARLTEIGGRFQDYFSIGFKKFHPYEIERILFKNKEVGGNYQIEVSKNANQALTIKVELMPGLSTQAFECYFQETENKITEDLHHYGIESFTLDWRAFGELPLYLGKAKRVLFK